jgi:hypothetical protein
MQILYKKANRYQERHFLKLFNDITYINITQRLHITLTHYFWPSDVCPFFPPTSHYEKSSKVKDPVLSYAGALASTSSLQVVMI